MDSERRRRVVCFLISLAVHVALFYLALNVSSPVNVYSVKEEITDLLIVPPEKLFLPRGYQDFEKAGEIDEFLWTRGRGQGKVLQKEGMLEKEAKTGLLSGEAVGMDKELVQRGKQKDREVKEQRSPGSDFSFDFKLQLPRRLTPGFPPDEEISLSPYRERKGKFLPEMDKERFAKSLSEYTSSDLSTARSVRGSSSHGRVGRKQASTRGKILYHAEGYDLTPWASEVVNRIQDHWIIPSSQRKSARGTVRILVRIEKSGDLSSIEIIKSSDVSVLDLLALNAIRSSLPFPRLPGDFPLKSLEAHFLFLYNE
ncbi:MAG: energy transducer TonB [Candidatus Aminicenantales bacterium]